MTRRRVLAVLAAALGLLVAVNALIWSLYRSEVRAVTGTLDDRLTALGVTAASWLAAAGREPTTEAELGTEPSGARPRDDVHARASQGMEPAGARPRDAMRGGVNGPASPLLGALVHDNRLEDAYLVDQALRVTAGVRTPAGAPLNLLRVDEARLARAFAGEASVGTGYSVANATVKTAYFPVRTAGAPAVLALEAGAEYHAPAAGLRRTYLVAVGLTALAAAVFAAGLGLALRALERARLAHGRAERLAAVGQMAAMVAREVRNTLGILRGQIELARERLGAAAPAREQERFAEMLAEVDRLNRLTEEFLGLTRDVALEPGELALGALAQAVAGEARIVAPGAEIVATGDATVHADAGKLRQALLNLVLNAVQVGGPGVQIAIEVAADGERARISVIDDGPGVPAELAERLFQPFVTARAGGTGLGLLAARRIAERHGGSLVLESRPGARGARFSLYLPRDPSRAA